MARYLRGIAGVAAGLPQRQPRCVSDDRLEAIQPDRLQGTRRFGDDIGAGEVGDLGAVDDPRAGRPSAVANRQSLIAAGLSQISLTSPLGVHIHPLNTKSPLASVVELVDQLDHAALDLVAGEADLRVLQGP